MRAVIAAAVCLISTAACATECLPSKAAVRAAHTHAHVSWGHHVRGHVGVMCYFDARGSSLRVANLERKAIPDGESADIEEITMIKLRKKRRIHQDNTDPTWGGAAVVQVEPASTARKDAILKNAWHGCATTTCMAMELRWRKILSNRLREWFAIFDATTGYDTHWPITCQEIIDMAFTPRDAHMSMIVTVNKPTRVVPAMEVDHEKQSLPQTSGAASYVASPEGRP